MANVTDAKKAKEIAEESARSFFPEASGIHLEEIALENKKSQWRVTLSFEIPPSTPSELLSIKKTKVYRVFTVESKSGSLISMKKRDMNSE